MPLADKADPKQLPPNPFTLGTAPYDAYEHCVRLERELAWNMFEHNLQKPSVSERIMIDFTPTMVARVLGHALRLAPSDAGRNVLTREIADCQGDRELLAGLAHLYVYGMIRVFYNPKGPTPSVSTTQSPRLSFEIAANAPSHLLEAPLATTRELRRLTLIRDESCIFTGDFDFSTDPAVLRAARTSGRSPIITATNVAHIISQSLSSDIGGMSLDARRKFAWASSAAAVLERFGDFSARDILGDDNLNSPLNAFTTEGLAHMLFDRLDLWLTPAQDKDGNVIPDNYDVRYPQSMDPETISAWRIKTRVGFRSVSLNDGTTIPPPHPRLLALHAACAQVAHMSGAAEHLVELYRDMDEISVMTEPSAPFELSRKLKALQLVSSLA